MQWRRELVRTLLACIAVGVACTAGKGSDSTRLTGPPVGAGVEVHGGGGPVAIAEAHAESGTRLKARWLVGTDGSRQFVNWYDSELKVECAFGSATDGTQRCMPAGAAAIHLAGYTDAACTQPLYQIHSVSKACAATGIPAFGNPYGATDSCEPFSTQVFALTGVIQPQHVYAEVDGSCQEQRVDTLSAYVGTEELSPSRMVAAEFATDE
jgi:hypothetical protein